jgi:hypothetical protein
VSELSKTNNYSGLSHENNIPIKKQKNIYSFFQRPKFQWAHETGYSSNKKTQKHILFLLEAVVPVGT